MLNHIYITTATLAVLALFAGHAKAADLTSDFDQKHKACLERIAEDSELALEDAMVWRSEGGGRRAKHCEAMALFALGHEDEAANRLDTLAKASDGGSPSMRANFYAEAANFWLASENPTKAYSSSTAGLEIAKNHIDLRIARARSYAMSGRYDFAETDLTSVLFFDAEHVDALRYRADARLQQDKLSEALTDIEKALSLDFENVETAVVRGRIKEAIRLKGRDDTSEASSDLYETTQ